MYSRKHSVKLARTYVLALGVVVLATGAMKALAEEAYGTGRTLDKAEENSLISAHFTCNRQGLWADPDTLEQVGVKNEKYRLAGGKRKMSHVTVTVTFDCTTEFKKEATIEEEITP
jgi:hypothetical protein